MKKEEVWKVVLRESVKDEFDIPVGFILMDVNENNFRRFSSKINPLITDEIQEKMSGKLAGFIKTAPESSAAVKEVGGMEVTEDVPTTMLSPPAGLRCVDSKYQCCPDLTHPQHGYQAYGCCASSQYGCCPDNTTPAPAPYFDASYIPPPDHHLYSYSCPGL